jgi:hypothetical protein
MPDQPELNLTGNQIGPAGKFFGGLLLVLFTITAVVALFAFWPDKLPDPKGNGEAVYCFKLFNIRLITDSSSTEKKQPVFLPDNSPTVSCAEKNKGTIDMNSIFLILVAITGFLGNMVYVASSFTTFVGNNSFIRTWIPWYIVKPFTASALAIIIYFLIRAGFLSYGSDARNVSLYGILAFSALAGLFTDTATLKLKEIFDAMFKPKDQREGKMTDLSIDGITPSELQKGVNRLSLKGKGLNSVKLTLKMDGLEITNPAIAPGSIDFSYTVAETVAQGTAVAFVVTNDKNVEIFKKQLPIQNPDASQTIPLNG